MLLTHQISFFKPRVDQRISCKKYNPQKTEVLLCCSNEKKELVLKKDGKKCDDYTHFTSPNPESISHGGGIGINKFFKGKNIFITGATGLLGKVLIEKLLRSTSVGKIYVLVKANDKESARDRLAKEIIESELFECIREKHGDYCKEFLQAKLIPVVGNICEANMGIDSYSANAIMEEVDVIIGSAGCTTLNGRYDVLLDANVNAPQRLMRFAKRCNNLKLFVHISTAYVNGKREGIIYEKPLIMGEHCRNHINGDDETSSSWLDLSAEVNLAMKLCIASTNLNAEKALKTLGQERCEYYGWNNSYTMSKALGEMVINEIREDVPVVIMRPSIIESTYKEPLPGWIQGKRMFDPAIIAFGKGQLPAYVANPETVIDIIPVDMVANTIIAAIAKHGKLHKSRDLNVYHVGSSFTNPLSMHDFCEYVYEYFKGTPLVESKMIHRIKFFDNLNECTKYTREELLRRRTINGQDEKMILKIQKQCKMIATYAEQMWKMHEFATFFNARFHTGNTLKLMEEMSKKEQLEFEVDSRKVNWKKYFMDIHAPGLLKYIISKTNKTSS